MTFFDKLLGRNKETSASRPEIMATTGGPTPDALSLNEVPVVRTSGHPADVRTGLWEQLERAWPSASFNTMNTEEINAHRAVVLEAINGLLTPTPPRNEEPAEHIDYELALLREKILQASRFSTAQLLPPRWVNDTTPAAPWVLAKSCASHLTDGGAAAMDTFAPYVVQCSERIADGIEADASWARVAEQVARGA